MKKFYVTTPIYYVNGAPSIGHAYTSIIADALARYHRLKGEEVFLLTGTDENSQKNVEAAEAAGRGDDVPGYLDEMAALWQRTFDSLGITNDRFIRTTEKDHHAAVEKFWRAVEKKGDIYRGSYEGYYCRGCEAFVVESELTDGKCAIHKKPAEFIKEENYFFRLSKYRDPLLKHIKKNPEFVQPKARRNEVVSYIEKFMTDLSITRQSVKAGIPVPGDPTQRIYVWFDALINYLTGVGYGKNDKDFKKWWPADLHLVGKDIIKFHCALWPAMLLAAGLPLPKSVLAHGFFTVNGDKMSKSLGNAIDPVPLCAEYGNDVVRYFLLREIRVGEDGDFSRTRLEQRYDGELASELGNLVHRVLTMTDKFFAGAVPPAGKGLKKLALGKEYFAAMDEGRLTDALEQIWAIVRGANQYIEQNKPWELSKNDKKKELAATMYNLLEALRQAAWGLIPLMPETAEKIFAKLGLTPAKELSGSYQKSLKWGGLTVGTKTAKGEPLFPRREIP